MTTQKYYNNDSYINKIKDKTNWDSETCKAIKEHIRDYLYEVNEGRCFFCKSNIKQSTTDETIEHIIGKIKYPVFTFHPKNLTLSCHECNRSKNEDETLDLSLINKDDLKKFDMYPFKKEFYTIIHPYLDNYYDCIDFNGIFYTGKNIKGTNTITAYNLTRYPLIEANIKNKDTNKILTNKILDTEVNVNDFFACGRLYKYLDKKIETNDRWSQEIIGTLKTLSEEDIHFFKLFKSLCLIYNNTQMQSIKETEFLNIPNLNTTLNRVEILLNLLNKTTQSLPDRRYISVLIDLNFEAIYDTYSEYLNLKEKDDKILILLNFKFFIELIKQYSLKYELINISKNISKDFEILHDLRLNIISNIQTK